MSMVDWIVGAEAAAATTAAAAAIHAAVSHFNRATLEAARANFYAARYRALRGDREGELFPIRLHRLRTGAGAQETTTPG